MHRIHPKKLQQSKWTTVAPRNREKHFLVTKVNCDAAGNPQTCVLEAVHSGREIELGWRELKDAAQWQIGWTG
jgi:tryptophan-rich hypothetical protein